MCTAGLHALQQPCSQTPPSLASHQVWAHQSQLEEQLTTRAQHCNALPWRQHVKSPASNSSSAHLPTLCLNHIKLASNLCRFCSRPTCVDQPVHSHCSPLTLTPLHMLTASKRSATQLMTGVGTTLVDMVGCASVS